MDLSQFYFDTHKGCDGKLILNEQVNSMLCTKCDKAFEPYQIDINKIITFISEKPGDEAEKLLVNFIDNKDALPSIITLIKIFDPKNNPKNNPKLRVQFYKIIKEMLLYGDYDCNICHNK